ncbi:hypothetical protein ACVILK_005631 [Bradyrhizobium embrapense]
MPAYKNQHFVPRCLLKPFTLGADGKAINLYSHRQNKLIRNAPVKKQCARDYLYGEDGVIERELATIEDEYVAVINRAHARLDTDQDRNALRFFAYLQLRRTEMAILRLRASEEGLFAEVFGHEEPERQPQRFYMLRSLQTCFETSETLSDLKVRIVENRTSTDFVISDDPAIYTNKYATQKLRLAGFGTHSSGLMLIMPLAPRLALICYDGLVYTSPNLENGRMILKKAADVEAMNELQYLAASSNVYFSDWDAGDYVRGQFEKSADRRIEEAVVFNHLVFVEGDPQGREIFRRATREEAAVAGRSVIHQTFRYPTPSRWLSQLKYRDPVITHSNGTGVGHVRKHEWLYA